MFDRLAGRVPGFDPPAAPTAPISDGRPREDQQGAASQGGRPRHCWVVDAPDVPGRWPGVLLGWKRDQDGWLGRVILGAEGRHGMVSMTLWVRGEHMQPVHRLANAVP